MWGLGSLSLLLAGSLPSAADAQICDYRLSELLGGGGASVVATGGTVVATVGPALSAAGFYTLTHSVTGLTMLGSTAGGASAAGTVGIMGGTAGIVGSVVAVLTAPVTVIIGAVAAVGVIGSEGICYFQDERITEFADVLFVIRQVADSANPEFFSLVISQDSGPNDSAEVYIMVYDGTSMARYDVRNLYIVNGVLMNRDWLRNTTIGTLTWVPKSQTGQ